MPTETELIAEQLRRAYEGLAWHGPSLKQILDGVTSEQAAKKPIAGAHSMHEITQHIADWMGFGRMRLSASSVVQVTPEQDWRSRLPEWSVTLAQLETEQRALEEAIRRFPVERLQETAPAEEAQTFYILLHGLVQHNLYHAGQLILLKRC